MEANSKKAVEGQLIALARAHNVLTESHWETASLRVVIASVLEPYLGRDKGMLRLDGPDLKIQPRAAVIMAMIINELATNAVKYGSLAAESGQVALSWSIGQEMGQKTIWIDWQERGGPSAPPSEDEGFGSVLIARSITEDLRGKVERAFTPSGIRWKMQIPLSEMTGPAGLLKATTATASSSITRGAA